MLPSKPARSSRRPSRRFFASCSALVLLLGACSQDTDPPATSEPTPGRSGTPVAGETLTASPTTTQPSPSSESAPPRRQPRRVLAISVDGLSVDAVLRLGPDGAPSLHRLLAEGAATLNARTAVEQTVTLPNHASMLTGRRIDADAGGHGLTWNEDVPGSVVPGKGDGVDSVFDVVSDHGGDTALFAGKDKFTVFERSWGEAIDEFQVEVLGDRLVAEVRAHLTGQPRGFTFLHLAMPDVAAHGSGFMSAPYLAAVTDTDRLLGSLLDTIEDSPGLRRRTVVVLTADHGGVAGHGEHSDASAYANYRIPFVVWGAGIEPADLYELNPDYRDPGTSQPLYDGPQPVRNGDLANLVTDLLGLGPVPDSQIDLTQDLDVSANQPD